MKTIINLFLGENNSSDFIETLKKSEEFDKIEKQLIPRIILSYLSLNLNDKDIDDTIDLTLPVDNSTLSIKKVSSNRYNGMLTHNDLTTTFNFKTIPSIALIVMSALNLYDIIKLDEIKQNPISDEMSENLTNSISEKLLTNQLVKKVLDNQIEAKDAINQLINTKIANSINKLVDKKEQIKQKLEKETEPKVSIVCPDCGTPLYKGGDKIKLCICYGEFFGNELKIKKSEETGKVTINFPKKFGIDNIEMLLSIVKDSSGNK